MAIEGSMVELAQRETVRNDRQCLRMFVRENVRGIQQLSVPQPANRTALAVRAENANAELLLVNRRCVATVR